MKPWIKRTLIGLFGVSILVGGLTACGHRPYGAGANLSAEQVAQYRAKVLDQVSSKLDLNADQKQRLGVLADKLHEQRTALIGQTKDPRAEVQALVAGVKFDRTLAQAIALEKVTALQSKSPDVITALADFYDSLNPVQQQKVRDFLAHSGHRFHRG
jgi:protein CpxP